METILNKKELGIHLLLLCFFCSLLWSINGQFPYYFNPSIRSISYLLLTAFALFYVHILALLPILLLEKDQEKYLRYIFWCIIGFVLIGLVIIEYSGDEFGLLGLRFDSFMNFRQVLSTIIAWCIMLLPIALLSFIYGYFIYDREHVSKYKEALIHILLLSAIYGFTVIEPRIGQVELIAISIPIFVFYIHAFEVLPILLQEKKQQKYYFSLLILCLGFYIAFLLLIGDVQHYYHTSELQLYLFLTLSAVLFVCLLLSFLYINEKEKKWKFKLKIGNKESELDLLKSQVNPHFLFNTLNTLYAAALEEEAPKTAKSAAKLASLIRYMQHDMQQDYIPLANEIKYLQDYIAIQKLRCAVLPNIKMTFENIENQMISPGLLIPFVENAFKYGINPTEKSSLSVTVKCRPNQINFECMNSYDEAFKPFYQEQGFGIGIKNAKKRLELVYPQKHSLKIEKQENIFLVKMSIQYDNSHSD